MSRRDLLWALTQRDILIKYRGSVLGLCWTFITPLALITIYTLVFSVFLNMTWETAGAGYGGFAIMLFCGLIPFNFFNETIVRASSIILTSPNYVKKIAFPTEILPIVANLSGMVHAGISIIILLVVHVVLKGEMHWTVLYVPVIWLPVILSCLACSFFVASVGVFIRDLPHMLGLIFSALFFLTPILYPVSSVPKPFQLILFINPMAYAASNMRKAIVLGLAPNWSSLLLYTLVSLLALLLALLYFSRIKLRFADVL